jgi:hypothetical protein
MSWASAAVYLNSSVLWLVMKRRLVKDEVLNQPTLRDNTGNGRIAYFFS